MTPLRARMEGVAAEGPKSTVFLSRRGPAVVVWIKVLPKINSHGTHEFIDVWPFTQ